MESKLEKLRALRALIKRHLDIVIMIVPKNGTKVRSFRYETVAIALLLYTAGVIWAVVSFTSVTGITETKSMSEADIEKVEELKERVIDLSSELEILKDSNRRLKNAIMLADSTVFDETKTIPVKKGLPKEGNIYAVVKHLISNLNEFQPESYYFIKPAEGFISRGFIPEKGHFGMDIVLKTGSAVYASGNGYVAFAGYTPEDGYIIIVNHSGEFVTLYKHCSAVLKKQRDFVVQGELIALSGNTGSSTGPHLHFEIWKKGVPENPEEYIFTNKEK
jgi:murein DD-endopeptidase MepM/ murein hydrolase activator NlpD